MTNYKSKKIIQKIVLGAVVFRKNKILILQRDKSETIFPLLWELPSGKRENLEKSEKALLREIKEETGLKKLKIISPISVFDYAIDKENEVKDSIQINFLVELIKGEDIKLSTEHQDYAWVDRDEVDKYKISRLTKSTILQAFSIINKKR